MKKFLFAIILLASTSLNLSAQVIPNFYGAKNPISNNNISASELKAVADINNDGHLDLIGVSSNYVRVAYLDGAETFLGDTSYLFALNTISDCDTADLNHDGFEDIVCTARGSNPTAQLFILMSDSLGRFSLTYTASAVDDGYELALGDFNDDGYTDAATVFGAGTTDVGIFFGNAAYTFDPVVYFNTGPLASMNFITAGDYNNDGRDDIAVTFGVSRYAVLMSDTSSSMFQITNYYPTSPIIIVMPIKSADFNQDGNLDLVYASLWGFTVVTNLGNGALPVSQGVYYPNTPGAYVANYITVADFNNDGYPDLFSGEQNNSGNIYLNDGTGAMFFSQRGLSGDNCQFADFNEDGHCDMVSNPRFCFANGDGSGVIPFSPRYGGEVNGNIYSANLNNDSYGDVFSYLPNICSAHVGNAAGGLMLSWSSSFSGGVNVTIADFTHDGNPDFATYRDLTDEIVIYSGNGAGSFVPFDSFAVQATSSNYNGWIASGDMNNDAYVDIVYGYRIANNSCYYAICLNNGDGTFAAPIINSIAGGYGFTMLEVALLNADNILDIVIRHSTANISVLLGTGNATYSAPATYTSNDFCSKIVITHVNYDPYPDICISEGSDLAIHYGNSTCTYSSFGLYTFDTGSQFACEDLNGDWYTDLAYSDGSFFRIALGDGNGNFTPLDTSYPAIPFAAGSKQIIGVDIDNDGLTDLVDAGLTVLHNITPGIIITSVPFVADEQSTSTTVYPNPATESVCVLISSVQNEQGTISIYDCSGALVQQEIHTLSAGENPIPVDVATLSAGIYVIEVVTGSMWETKKIVVE